METKKEWEARNRKLSGEVCKHGVPIEHNCLGCWSELILNQR